MLCGMLVYMYVTSCVGVCECVYHCVKTRGPKTQSTIIVIIGPFWNLNKKQVCVLENQGVWVCGRNAGWETWGKKEKEKEKKRKRVEIVLNVWVNRTRHVKLQCHGVCVFTHVYRAMALILPVWMHIWLLPFNVLCPRLCLYKLLLLLLRSLLLVSVLMIQVFRAVLP